MATYSSILARKIPRTEGPGELQFMGSPRVRHDWARTQAPNQTSRRQFAGHASILESNAVTRKSWVLETQFTEDSLHNTLTPMRAITLNSSHPYHTDYIIQEYPECMDLSWVNQLYSKWNDTIFITSKEHAELLVNIMITFSSTIP